MKGIIMIQEYEVDDAQKDLQNLIYLTIENHTPVKIRNKDGKSIYLISEEDYTSMEETFYLLKNPKNAEHLIKSLNEDNGIKFDSIEALKNEIGI
jgi:antitoxin YefM